MTVGQRITQKRKELGLSQEGLGERLGVSRQTVYKWESDAALPEIEKLVNLSREFSVSIDWLLGQEDEAREPRELTPEQLRMVEEIVERYLAARPRPEPAAQETDPEAESETGRLGVRWLKRWGLAWAGLAALVAIVMVFFNLFDRLGSVRQDYQVLQNSVFSIREDVNRQINGITQRVEEVLQSQNTLAAEQSAQVVATDYRANTVTVSARAMPRTYVEGMAAEFVLASGGETVTVPGGLGDDHAFAAQATGPLSDEITVSVVFLTGNQRQTQMVEKFSGLYSSSFPTISFSGGMQMGKLSEATNWRVVSDPVDVYCYDVQGNPTRLSSLRVGLFRDQKLVAWLIQKEGPDGPEGGYTFQLERDMEVESDSLYSYAAVAEDEFGRELVVSDFGAAARVTDSGPDFFPDLDYSGDPADWEY